MKKPTAQAAERLAQAIVFGGILLTVLGFIVGVFFTSIIMQGG